MCNQSDGSSGDIMMSFAKSVVQDSAFENYVSMPGNERDVVDEDGIPFSVDFHERREESDGEDDSCEYGWVDETVLKMHTLFTLEVLFVGMDTTR